MLCVVVPVQCLMRAYVDVGSMCVREFRCMFGRNGLCENVVECKVQRVNYCVFMGFSIVLCMVLNMFWL